MKKSKSHLRSVVRAFALEPRLLFDGAGAVGAADAFTPEQNEQAPVPVSYAAPALQTQAEGRLDSAQNTSVDGVVSLGENDGGNPLKDWDVTGSGTITVTLEPPAKGEIKDVSGAPAVSFSGTVEKVNQWLDELVYLYTGSSEEGDHDSLTFTFTTYQDGQTSTVEKTQVLSISSQNDAVVVGKADQVVGIVDEGGIFSFGAAVASENGKGFTHAVLGIVDPDNSANQVIIKLEEVPDIGDGSLVLTRGGQNITLVKGATFSVAELANLTFKHSGAQVPAEKTVSVQFTIDDGAGGRLEGQKVFLNLNPVNQAPSVIGEVTIIEGEGAVSLGLGGAFPLEKLPEGKSAPVLAGDRGKIAGSDPDDTLLTYRIASLPEHGTLSYDGKVLTVDNIAETVITDLNKLTFSYPQGTEPSSHGGKLSFDIFVTDAGGGTGQSAEARSTITLNILENNDDPLLVKNVEQELAQIGTNSFTITPEMLAVSDLDSTSNKLVFKVVEVTEPSEGYFTLNGLRLVEGSSFTMLDVEQGRVQYQKHSGSSEARVDSFKFTVTDSDIGIVFNADGTAQKRNGGLYDATGALAVNTFSVKVPANEQGPGGDLPAPPDTLPEPKVTVNKPLNGVLEGQKASAESVNGVVITSDMLSATDGKSSPAQIIFRLEKLPASGTLFLDGKALNWFGASFSQADIDSGKVTFQHGGDEIFADSFAFSVSNGVTESSALSEFKISSIAQNDTPEARQDQLIKVLEGEVVTLSPESVVLSDRDQAASVGGYANKNDLWFVFDRLPDHGVLKVNGTIVTDANKADFKITQADLAAGHVIYAHAGDEQFADSFTVRPFDNQDVVGEKITATNQSSQGQLVEIKISISPVNDAPVHAAQDKQELVASGGNNANLYEGGKALIYGSQVPAGTQPPYGQLSYIDPDNTSDQIQYRVTEAPKYGQLMLGTQVLSKGSVFTQADLDAGLISYQHNGGQIHLDKFEYLVSDGDFTVNDKGESNAAGKPLPAASVYNIHVRPSNDKPVFSSTPSKPLIVDGQAAANNALPGFAVRDPDLNPAVNGETDYVTVIVRVTDLDGRPQPDLNYSLQLGVVTGVAGSTQTSDAQRYLQFSGKAADVNKALESLQVGFGLNNGFDYNELYQLEVIVDDRLSADQSVYQNGGADVVANGGDRNQSGAALTAVDAKTYDWRADKVSNDSSLNLSVAKVELWVSTINQPAELNVASGQTVAEDTATKLTGISVSDPESEKFGTDMELTLSVGSGALEAKGLPSGITATLNEDKTRVVLKGAADKLNQYLASTAENVGVYYTSAADANHDQNGNEAGDVTLTVTLAEGESAMGGDVGQGSVANSPIVKTTALTIEARNDAPTVNAGSGQITVTSAGSVAIGGVSVADVDSADGYSDGEADGVIEVTVRLLNQQSQALTKADYQTNGLSVSSTVSDSGVVIDSTHNGAQAALQLRGTLAQINAYLAGLQLDIAAGSGNVDGTYKVQVIADDRLREIDGALKGAANGGALNQAGDAVAAGEFDPYAADLSAVNVGNRGDGLRDVFLSTVNDPGRISGNNVSVDEGKNSIVLDAANAGLALDDPDHNGSSSMTVTVSVDKAMIISAVGGSGGTVAGIGSSSINITGATQEQINSRLQALSISFPDIDGSGPVTASDWNGSFNVSVVYNDQGNTGMRPGSLLDDTNQSGANPGDFAYVDETSNALVTTRVITVTVSGVNDAPQVTDKSDVILDAAVEDTSSAPGKTVAELFADRFSDPLDAFSGVNGSSAGTFAGIAITGNSASTTQGTWQYSTDNGASWTSLPEVSATEALFLDGTAKLRFNPAADFHGTPGALSVRVAENNSSTRTLVSGQSADVAGDRFSVDSLALKTTVSAVNDRPVGRDTALPAINEDSTDPVGSRVDTLSFQYTDAKDDQRSIAGGGNSSSAFGGLAVIGNAADADQGTWQYNTGSGWTAVGSPSGTQALVLPTDAQLRFVPAANFNGEPGKLTVLLADTTQVFAAGSDLSAAQGPTATWSEPVTVGISVNPQNDAPSFSHAASNPTFTEGNGAGPTDSPAVKLLGSGTVTDLDLASTPGLSTGVFGAGQIVVSLDKPLGGDLLQVPALDGIKGTPSYDAATGTLTIDLLDTATIAQVNAVLEAIAYRHTGEDPTQNNGQPRTELGYSVRLSDGNNTQNGQTAGGPNSLDAAVVNGVITLVAVNDPPKALPDTNRVREDSHYEATGNVITGERESVGAGIAKQIDSTSVDSDPDTLTENLKVTSVTVGGVDYPVDQRSAQPTVIDGQYGTLTLWPDGRYSYALDNTNPRVNALVDGDNQLSDVFTYTLSDGNKTDQSTLTIGIDGRTDSNPMLDPNTVRAEVYEKGLEQNDGSQSTTGTLDIVVEGGLKTLTVGGVSFTVEALRNLSLNNPSAPITTPYGELVLTGFSFTSGTTQIPRDGQISWQYTLTTAQNTPAVDRGVDPIEVLVTDAQGTPGVGRGTLEITIYDDQPQANADRNQVRADQQLAGRVSGNLRDQGSAGDQVDYQGADGASITEVDGVARDPQAQSITVTGQYGVLTVQPDGRYDYVLDPAKMANAPKGADLTEVFDYTLSDADGDSDTSTLTLTILRPPVAVDDAVTTPEDTPVSGNVITGDNGGNGADSDPENDPLSVISFEVQGKTYQPGETANISGVGELILNVDGSYTFTPAANWHGTVPDVTYTISDGRNGTDQAALKITVTSVDDVPVAVDDVYEVDEGKTLTGSLQGNDTPSGDGGNRWLVVTPPANGVVTLNPDGSFEYTANRGFIGTETFTYEIVDADGSSSVATVTITVTRADDWRPAPSPILETPTRPEGAAITGLPGMTPWQGAQVGDPSVYFLYESERQMARLPNPLHPALFVSHSVRDAQVQRSQSDEQANSNSHLASPLNLIASSRSLNLGLAPGQFVMGEVGSARDHSSMLSLRVDGRFSRTSLSVDQQIGTPDLRLAGIEAMVPLVWRQIYQQDVPNTVQSTEGALQPDTVQNPESQPQPNTVQTPEAPLQAQPTTAQAAPSFTEQLRASANRLPPANTDAPRS